MDSRPPGLLCLTSYHKGEEFLREAKRQGARVLFLTISKLADEPWPRESIDAFFQMPDLFDRDAVINGVSYLARTEPIDRLVALDEFDMEMASTLRAHLRVPGMGETTVRSFRDKLAMREGAAAQAIRVPRFVHVLNHQRIHAFTEQVPTPWILKPRTSASAIGLRKLHSAEELWSVVEALGDEASHHLLEEFVAGDVYHVDAIVARGELLFEEVHQYAVPPFDVMHGGGLFCSSTVERGSSEDVELERMNRQVVRALGMTQGVLHTEFIRGRADGKFYFLETAGRVGGAHIVDMVEAATGLNLWREWARLEIAAARGEPYQLPEHHERAAGVLISLARQEWPDTSAYDDPEIVWRMHKRHHAGLVVTSENPSRVRALLKEYMQRFRDDFMAVLPAPDKPTS